MPSCKLTAEGLHDCFVSCTVSSPAFSSFLFEYLQNFEELILGIGTVKELVSCYL